MKVAAFDIATVCGYAVSGSIPEFGSQRMGARSCSFGECYAFFYAWVHRRLEIWKPDVVVFESPILGRGRTSVAQKLMGLAAIAELAATQRGLKAYQAENATIMKHFTGRGGRWPSPADKKRAVIEACKSRGWNVGDDHNAADALALMDFCQSMLNRQAAVDRAAGPLFR